MATSLLRLGRLGSLKFLLREIGGTQKTPFVAALCTKADAPPKTPKKAKAASKTKEAGERASLLAYKPAVAFPSKLSATGFLPKDIALGESDSAANVVKTETMVAPADTTEHQPLTSQSVTKANEHFTKEVDEAISTGDVEIPEGHPADKVSAASNITQASDVKAEVQQDQEDTSSSSSSDSESDSDDDKSKTETVVKSEEKAAEGVLKSKQVENNVESESVITPSASFEKSPKYAQAKGVPTASTEAVGSGETLIDPAPVISSSMMEAIPEVTGESIDVSPDEMVDSAAEVKTAPSENIVENESETIAYVVEEEEQQPAGVKTSPKVVPEVTVECSPQEVANTTAEYRVAADVSESVQEVVSIPEREATSEMVVKDVNATKIETASSEELGDPAPVAADAVAAQSLAETVAEAPEEQALEKEPEPEPFENTTYKNLQHHHYNMYTFVDMDVEMAKHRLPQPSSGRPSPRH